MRAALMTMLDSPWAVDEASEPVPGPGQVLIQVHASGMCGTDLHIRDGLMRFPLPIVLGHEPVGEIVATGAGVADLNIGERVGVSWTQRGCGRCEYCQRQTPKYCGNHRTWADLGGGNAELMVAWAEGCTLIPEGLSSELAAPLFCAGYTVVSGLRNAQARSGDRIAVLGIGGLGHLAIQYAKALGHEVIALTSTAEKVADALTLGADHAVLVGHDAGDALRGVGGANVVLSTSNSAKHVAQAMCGLRPEGCLVQMGLLDQPLTVDTAELMFRQTRLIGSMQNNRSDLIEILTLAAAGRIKPWVEIFPLANINDALARLASGHLRYRAVIDPRR